MTPKKKPPPNRLTVRRAGFSRSQKRNHVVIGWPTNGTLKPAARLRFSRLNTPTAMFGRRRAEARGDALGRDVDVGRVGEAVQWDQVAQGLDERQRPGELELVEVDVDLGLLPGANAVLDPLEPEDQVRELEIERVE